MEYFHYLVFLVFFKSPSNVVRLAKPKPMSSELLGLIGLVGILGLEGPTCPLSFT